MYQNLRIHQQPQAVSRDHKPQSIKQLSEKEEKCIVLILNHLSEDNVAIQLTVYIEGKLVLMELDSGAVISFF